MVRFDLPHAGHVTLLDRCVERAEMVIVSLNTDEFIEEYKGRPPIMSYKERKSVLEAFEGVDQVIPNTGGADSKPAIETAIIEWNVDTIAIGSDWHERDYLTQMGFDWNWLEEKELGILYLPYTQTISTTELKRRIREQGNSNS